MNENDIKIVLDCLNNIDEWFMEKNDNTFSRDIAVALYIMNEELKGS